MERKIIIKGARQHNLKNINLEIPKDKLVVITGLSGSGKSSLAFDTIFAEGQRRYLESLSTYARQFMEQMDKPDVDFIEGLSPAISIEQKSVSKNPRSTVGTVTEIYDYLRVLFARIGMPYCYKCGKKIEPKTIDQMTEAVFLHKTGEKLIILSPVAINRKGEFKAKFEEYLKHGFYRIYADKKEYNLEDPITLDKNKKHDIDLVIDRILIKEENKKRLADSIELALKLSQGVLKLKFEDKEEILTENSICLDCGISYGKPEPSAFSFNSPQGACPFCDGLGYIKYLDEDLIVPDKKISLKEGAISVLNNSSPVYKNQIINALSKHYGFSADTPYEDLTHDNKQVILHGSGGEKIKFYDVVTEKNSFYLKKWEGIIPMLEESMKGSRYIIDARQFISEKVCPECCGFRLKKDSLSYKINDMSIIDITNLSVKNALKFFEDTILNEHEQNIAFRLINEIKDRLKFLVNVGLDYLTLARTAQTLSGGELQRIRLASQIGSGLTGVLYVLDEPSIGLHMRDNERLLKTIMDLREKGNSLIVVEHDMLTMLEADFIVDMGPGAGKNGGYVVASGTPPEIMNNPGSLTGKYLSGQVKVNTPFVRRGQDKNFLEIKGAKKNNLKNIDIAIPLENLVCVTGVSGSGKSTLIIDTLYAAVSNYKNGIKDFKRSEIENIKNIALIDRIIDIDQSPIGRTPRSNPATYTGIFTLIREIFAGTREARARGYNPGRFSFNVKGGRCEACSGDGVKKIEMLFMPDVYVVCDICKGKRYNRQTLEITYKNKNIYDILNMTVKEACEFFGNIPALFHRLKFLTDVGLDYINLGQLATTLSGGEAQRIKLSKELSRPGQFKTLYILDEPTTGLHFDDIKKLLNILNLLVDSGNTVIVIEHNIDVIKSSDYIIDMGPEGGDEGGYIVACGAPEDIVLNNNSVTGRYLAGVIL
ncbi:MAG: excinuclease ABC subunit UvrA [Deltaproteobacteria bacterium]|nr:excinuclease ABC subunit UvrA [Deltaproteobacteria bacterium]